MLDCLQNIVGLANTSCTCWDASKPIDFNTLNASTSGKYVASSSGIPLRWTNSAADCENGGIWNLLIDARTEAITNLLKDFLGSVQETRQEKFSPFSIIGDAYYSAGATNTANVVGFWIEPYEIKGGILRIKSANVAFWSGIVAPTNVEVKIFSSLNLNTEIASATVSVTANQQQFEAIFPSEVLIELGNIRTDLNERIFIAYELPVGAIPINNNTYITACCGTNKFDKNPYLQIMCDLNGVQSTSFATLNSPTYNNSGKMNGLTLNASFTCDYYSWLCLLAQQPNQVYSLNDGQRLKLGMALADGIQAASVMSLANSLIMSGRVNQFTMINEDKRLYAIASKAKKVYDDAIHNLVYYMPYDVSDCLICNPNKIINKGSILVKK